MKHSKEVKYQLMFLMILGILTIFANTLFLGIFVNADELNPGVYSKDSKPYEISYGEWLAKFWTWFIQIPADVHPREHYTPERCATAQSGPVWFLSDILADKEERNCEIPSGKAILLPILNGICWSDESDPIPMSDQDLIKCAKEGNEYGVISATIDGREIKELNSYRAESPFFNITVPENNIFNNMPGVWKAKVDGFFLFLEPLPPGNHTLRTTTSVINPTSPEYNYAADLKYNLMVKP
jgi:hypothetical protein